MDLWDLGICETYQFTDILAVAIKGQWLGSLDAIALQKLKWSVYIARGVHEQNVNLFAFVYVSRFRHTRSYL